MILIKNLYEYRELLKTNVKKEIRGKYKGSILGVMWSFINPLLQVLVYSIVFSIVMRIEMDHYIVFLITGIIPWTFFTTVMNQGITSITTNAGIIKKVYFPREILPISVVVSGLVNFLISCVIVLAFAFVDGAGISWHIIFLPIIAAIQMLLSLGLVFALSAINVYIKDVEYIVQFILNMLFYASPIIYPITQFPLKYQWVLYLNPMTSIFEAYRDIFLNHKVPDMSALLVIFLLATIIFFVGMFIFKKLEKGFAEEV